MSENTGIQWCDSTFNIAWGCTKISPGCANCYAETETTRYGMDVWGPQKERRTFGLKHWHEPVRWNKAAKAKDIRRRVFCSSMADVFEDHPTIIGERLRLLKLITETTALDWLLLTKRAAEMRRFIDQVRRFDIPSAGGSLSVDGWPLPNLWLGVSVENQEAANERIPELIRTPAVVRFLSVEPLLSKIDLRLGVYENEAKERRGTTLDGIDWVIVGGESGPGARRCEIAWIRSIVEQCKAARVPVFVKQLGSGFPNLHTAAGRGKHATDGDKTFIIHQRKGGDPNEWPADLRVREFPNPQDDRLKGRRHDPAETSQ